jgi:hypothetical protein
MNIPANRKSGRWLNGFISTLVVFSFTPAAPGASTHTMVIDGNFADWASVPSHYDPAGGPGVLHNGIPDTHDTDHSLPNDVPAYVDHPDIDLLEFKFTHDTTNLYAYFRATGVIGRTISNSAEHGRYYVIVTIDVDASPTTGYGLHEGGYYPTSYGYDMNMEVEFFDGHLNKGNYLNHGARDTNELAAAFQDQTNGIVRVLPGTYKNYTEWVWFDSPTTGVYRLPPPDDFASITFVKDKGPSYQGIVRLALSPDGHEAEMAAPFRGFMRDPAGNPIMAVGKTLNISISLEASGELAPGGEWASDTGDPIVGYYLSPYTDAGLQISPPGADGNVVLSWAAGATGMRLQRTPSLTLPDWQSIQGSEATNRVRVAAAGGRAFFRLIEP